tara:strand:- start:79 stop:585 length:507 start_codon:yes stop_codon:yes gene_type:complete
MTTYTKIMWKGDNQLAQTPPEVWEPLKEEFGELFDPCPMEPEVDGLSIPWSGDQWNYVNPPYDSCQAWLQKCAMEFIHDRKIVALIPCRTNTNWWFNWVLPYATEIRFIKNGVKFVGYKRKSPFPVALVVYDPEKKGQQIFKGIDFYPKTKIGQPPKKKLKQNLKPEL